MEDKATMSAMCRCADANHTPGCPMAAIDFSRGELHAGMYDPGTAPVARVRLLNPACADDDATSRRFALVEID